MYFNLRQKNQPEFRTLLLLLANSEVLDTQKANFSNSLYRPLLSTVIHTTMFMHQM